MTELFEISDYRKIVRFWIKSRPQKGRGEIQKISDNLGIPASVFSLTLSGSRDLSPDHALLLAEYMGLMNLEKDYFLTLVQIEKASHHKYKDHLKKKLLSLKEESLNLIKRITHEKKLDDQDQQEFYSSWIYSGIRLYCSIGDGATLDELNKKFMLTQESLLKILDFLVRTGLVVQKNSKYQMGPQRTFLERSSHLVGRHHTNWRLKAIERSSNLRNQELMFTGPLTCSKKDQQIIREKLAQTIKEIADLVKDSSAEEFWYFGIDFIKMGDN